jgi:hypothetical protein
MSEDNEKITPKFTVLVWACTFFKVDADGIPLLNEDGTVKVFKFKGPNLNWAPVTEGIECDDLVEESQ